MQIGRKMCHIKSWQFNKILLMGKCLHALPTQKGRLNGVTEKTSNLVFLSLSAPSVIQVKESFNTLTSFNFTWFIKIPRMQTNTKFSKFYYDQNTTICFSSGHCDHCIPGTLFSKFSLTSATIIGRDAATLKLVYSSNGTVFTELNVTRISSICH